jgi:hypothetical protein
MTGGAKVTGFWWAGQPLGGVLFGGVDLRAGQHRLVLTFVGVVCADGAADADTLAALAVVQRQAGAGGLGYAAIVEGDDD